VTHISLIFVATCGLLAAVTGAALPLRIRVSATAALIWVTCAAATVASTGVLHSGHPVTFHSDEILPLSGVTIALEPLGALFVVVTAVVAVATTIYWIGYASHGLASRSASALIPIFITSMLLVPAAGSVSTFMVLWELMALSSLLLVMVDQRQREGVRSAATWYGVLTHVGAAAILLGLVLVSGHVGTQSFAAIRHHAGHLPTGVRNAAFLLALVGFTSKAGAVPFHVWLPKAHPEAPSPASALMSGAMVNLGIYGVILMGDQLLGGGPAWWWLTVMVIGVASALFGALHAATSVDLKRLLAYSTTDNMGLILIGVGSAGLFLSAGHTVIAIVSMVAALLLMVNHAVFKGCLFLSAGSIQVATGTRNLDRLGGLMRRLPITAVLFLIGGLSVMALPPFNGFIGEWLLFQSLMHGLASSTITVAVVVPLAVAALALTGGLTAVAFVKAIGVGLLGRPRTLEAQAAHEVPRTMQLGAGLLSMLCLVLGIAPMIILPSIERAASMALTGRSTDHVLVGGGQVAASSLQGALEPAWLAAGLALALAIAVAMRNLLRRHPSPRRSNAWAFGRPLQTSRMQYTATSFAEPIERVFDDVLRPTRDLAVGHVEESQYFVEKVAYATSIDDVIEVAAYRPIITAARWWGRRMGSLQNGSVHRYLAYGLIGLAIILVVSV
jgi:hydrogenase-4 component B